MASFFLIQTTLLSLDVEFRLCRPCSHEVKSTHNVFFYDAIENKLLYI